MKYSNMSGFIHTFKFHKVFTEKNIKGTDYIWALKTCCKDNFKGVSSLFEEGSGISPIKYCK